MMTLQESKHVHCSVAVHYYPGSSPIQLFNFPSRYRSLVNQLHGVNKKSIHKYNYIL